MDESLEVNAATRCIRLGADILGRYTVNAIDIVDPKGNVYDIDCVSFRHDGTNLVLAYMLKPKLSLVEDK